MSTDPAPTWKEGDGVGERRSDAQGVHDQSQQLLPGQSEEKSIEFSRKNSSMNLGNGLPSAFPPLL